MRLYHNYFYFIRREQTLRVILHLKYSPLPTSLVMPRERPTHFSLPSTSSSKSSRLCLSSPAVSSHCWAIRCGQAYVTHLSLECSEDTLWPKSSRTCEPDELKSDGPNACQGKHRFSHSVFIVVVKNLAEHSVQ